MTQPSPRTFRETYRSIYCMAVGPTYPVKIGMTLDIEGRKIALNSIMSGPPVVYWTVAGMPWHEKQVHRALSIRHLGGEWFEDEDDAIKNLRPANLEHLLAKIVAEFRAGQVAA